LTHQKILVVSYRPESEFIRSFVGKISSELNDTIKSVYKDKYGIESRVEEIVSCYMDTTLSDDVRFIGICGIN
jgi:hypothetical protein